jgi:hypothetical protein
MLFFTSDRSGGLGDQDIWVARRASPDDDWGAPVNLGPRVNTPGYEIGPCISADGRTLYFQSGHERGYSNQDIWQVSIDPVVDFNGDEIVDDNDLDILNSYIDTNEPLCDIGPMPWGDGIVDEADQEVLMSYYGKEFLPNDLIAYWKLDETEGIIAYDSVGDDDGTLNGEPLWQPEGGMVGGAIELDGIDDYMSTPLVLETKPISFSIFVWVKGGQPGQVIISYASSNSRVRSNWLAANAIDGSLMTELRFFPNDALPLHSQSVITDGDWHRVGLVWDTTDRTLYVDDVEVASDVYKGGSLLSGDLHIGAGMQLESGTYWSGLIDDVRIYDRTVTP